jgi:two-component system sensor histidine kinase QseC
LTISLLVVLVVSLSSLALVVSAIISRALERQFDGRLLDDALAVAGMSEDDQGRPEFEYESLPDFEHAERPAYFEAWLDDGTVLARSTSLGARDLALSTRRSEGPVFGEVRLPDGRPGRVVRLRQPLRVELPAVAAGARAGRSTRYVTVAVARGTEDLVEAVASVRRWLVLLAGLTLVSSSVVAVAAVARGLRSTRALGTEIAALDVAKLGRIASSDVPAELVPLVDKVNDLLLRVETSLEREKRFTADVSHELRTPLAAIRTTLDVVASRRRSAPELEQALADVSGVVRQMQALCENLLALARLDSGPVPLRLTDVELRALVDGCWTPLADTARARGLTFSNELAANSVAVTDPEQLRVIVTNLLSNAATYTARGGHVTVRRSGLGSDRLLEVHDSGPAIPDRVLPHIFERFFRGDPARTDGIHCGIGLALARGIAELLRLNVTARNTPDGGVSFELCSRGE